MSGRGPPAAVCLSGPVAGSLRRVMQDARRGVEQRVVDLSRFGGRAGAAVPAFCGEREHGIRQSVRVGEQPPDAAGDLGVGDVVEARRVSDEVAGADDDLPGADAPAVNDGVPLPVGDVNFAVRLGRPAGVAGGVHGQAAIREAGDELGEGAGTFAGRGVADREDQAGGLVAMQHRGAVWDEGVAGSVVFAEAAAGQFVAHDVG